jgi:Cu-Zn family superoxide dismutase
MRIVPTVLSALLLASAATFAAAGTGQAAGSPVHVTNAHAKFAAVYTPGTKAVTYKPELVPAGSRVQVFGVSGAVVGTATALVVSGLLPKHEYGAHAHALPCGAIGDAAGPHFQNTPDPVKPSVDPAYANPDNEIWLDFTTDRAGSGFALSKVDWAFGERRAHSVVIHEMHTHTDPGHAGTAGARLACVNVDF